MLKYLSRKLLSGICLLFIVSAVTFVLIFGSTENVARNILGESATAEDIAAYNHQLGIDRPLLVQYGSWLQGALRGDLGDSWTRNQRVAPSLQSRLPVTLSIVGVAVLLTGAFSVLLGVTAAVRRGLADQIIQVISVVGFAMPNFWLGLLLVLLFAVQLQWLPPTGYVSFSTSPQQWAAGLVLPVAALVFSGIASSSQQVRGAVIDALNQDYVRTLRARGVRRRSILYRHALRNALPAALTVLSVQFVALLGGAAVIERIFAIPGLGSLTVDAALQGDVPVLMGVVVTLVIVVVIVNIMIDVLNAMLNPKVRLQ
ncbi:peptide/nickel transport system permease protein [Pseudooceanicola antarcticus]|uniref:ABC transporter permease n=1 Tax=Pseudooceanicola antarcticus TaxID=1247613 RepID=A0A285JCL5_9RHOB|nr:ABC transporter permease [Pseudooceanicola antarcticus]PJE30947.1 ABC transporter permease [Pseudooceanicola antarcticus]SNY58004.1 peptide/nickel transport system permease protein [Pseudooceanicola antarcticus]